MLIQSSFMDWLGSNLAAMVFAWGMLLFIIMIIYVRLFVHSFYKGTLYRHYRRGRLLTESDQGGRVLLIPFIDRLEVFDSDDETDHDSEK
jgi:hypothetical protein